MSNPRIEVDGWKGMGRSAVRTVGGGNGWDRSHDEYLSLGVHENKRGMGRCPVRDTLAPDWELRSSLRYAVMA